MTVQLQHEMGAVVLLDPIQVTRQLVGALFSKGNNFQQATKPVFPHFKVL